MRRFFFGWVIIFSVLLSGCAEGIVNVKVHRDGSSDFTINMLTDLTWLVSPKVVDNILEEFKAEDFSVSELERDGKKGYLITRHFTLKDYKKFGEAEKSFSPSKSASEWFEIQVEEGFWKNTYHVALHLGPDASILQAIPFSNFINKQLDFQFQVDIPIEAKSTNAPNVKKEEGSYLYSWPIKVTEQNNYVLSVEFWNIRNVFLIAGSVFVLFIVLVGVRLYSKRKK